MHDVVGAEAHVADSVPDAHVSSLPPFRPPRVPEIPHASVALVVAPPPQDDRVVHHCPSRGLEHAAPVALESRVHTHRGSHRAMLVDCPFYVNRLREAPLLFYVVPGLDLEQMGMRRLTGMGPAQPGKGGLAHGP